MVQKFLSAQIEDDVQQNKFTLTSDQPTDDL